MHSSSELQTSCLSLCRESSKKNPSTTCIQNDDAGGKQNVQSGRQFSHPLTWAGQWEELLSRMTRTVALCRTRAREREELGRLMTIPGVGPVCAMAVHTFAPPMKSFKCGRDFAAQAGLTLRRRSAAGRQRLGRITRMGQRGLRQLLVPGAASVLRHARRRAEFG